MICSLKGLALVNELSIKSNTDVRDIKDKYKEDIKSIKNKLYINKYALPYSQRKVLTDLDEYLPISLLIEKTGIGKKEFHKRINFMKKNNNKGIFHFIEVCNLIYIKVPYRMIELLSTHNAFHVTFDDTGIDEFCMLGDLKIGFWK